MLVSGVNHQDQAIASHILEHNKSGKLFLNNYYCKIYLLFSHCSCK